MVGVHALKAKVKNASTPQPPKPKSQTLKLRPTAIYPRTFSSISIFCCASSIAFCSSALRPSPGFSLRAISMPLPMSTELRNGSTSPSPKSGSPACNRTRTVLTRTSGDGNVE